MCTVLCVLDMKLYLLSATFLNFDFIVPASRELDLVLCMFGIKPPFAISNKMATVTYILNESLPVNPKNSLQFLI